MNQLRAAEQMLSHRNILRKDMYSVDASGDERRPWIETSITIVMVQKIRKHARFNKDITKSESRAPEPSLEGVESSSSCSFVWRRWYSAMLPCCL